MANRFEFAVRVPYFSAQTFRQAVEFVPPDQMRLSENFGWIMHDYYVRIGQRAWANWSPFPWGWSEEYLDPRYIQMKLGAGDPFSAVLSNSPPIYECLGKVEFEGTAYLGYRARLTWTMDFVVVNGTLTEAQKRELDRTREQMPQEWRTVFVDPVSRLPAYELVAQANQLSNPSSTVRYTYPNINIEPPLWCRLGLCGSVRRRAKNTQNRFARTGPALTHWTVSHASSPGAACRSSW